MTDNFIPTHDSKRDLVPYFEKARADYAPYYSSTVSVNSAKAQVVAELANMLKLNRAPMFGEVALKYAQLRKNEEAGDETILG